MNILQFNTECEALETKLSDLGFISPDVTSHLRFVGSPIALKVTARYSTDPFGKTLRSEFFKGDDPELVLKEASAWIDEQPTPDQSREQDFLERLAYLTEEARDMNMPILADLEATMKRLSTNIITLEAPNVVA